MCTKLRLMTNYFIASLFVHLVSANAAAQSSPRGGTGSAAFQPNPVWHGHTLRVIYDQQSGPLHGAAQIYLHLGFDNWEIVEPQDTLMTFAGQAGVYDAFVGVSGNVQVDVAFHDGQGNWDNNAGADWHAPIINSPGGWLMDGQVDPGATLIAQSVTLQLHAGFINNKLYVAVQDAGEGNDHFIFISSAPGGLQGAPWGKSGQVANWSAFLADENDNDFEGWFDSEPATTLQKYTGPNGGWLEGSIDLQQEFGTVPDVVYMAFAPYGTGDGSSLIHTAQIPASTNGDGILDPGEFAVYVIYPKGDMNSDRQVTEADIETFVAVLLGLETNSTLVGRADVDGNSAVDGHDSQALTALLTLWP